MPPAEGMQLCIAVCCRREGNRKASERLRQKQKARLVGLEGRCSELEAANTAAQQQVTSLLNVCQCVLQQNALLQQQLRHVLAGVQRSPAAGVAAAAQVAAMLAQQSALGAAPGAMAPPMPDGAWPGMPPLRPEQLPAAPSVPAAGLLRGLPLQPPAMGDMGQQLPGTHPAIAQAAVQGLPEGQPWAPFGAAGPLPMAHAMMINASQVCCSPCLSPRGTATGSRAGQCNPSLAGSCIAGLNRARKRHCCCAAYMGQCYGSVPTLACCQQCAFPWSGGCLTPTHADCRALPCQPQPVSLSHSCPSRQHSHLPALVPQETQVTLLCSTLLCELNSDHSHKPASSRPPWYTQVATPLRHCCVALAVHQHHCPSICLPLTCPSCEGQPAHRRCCIPVKVVKVHSLRLMMTSVMDG